MLELIKADIKTAMQSGEKDKVTTLRGLVSAIQSAAIEKRSELSDEEIISVLQKESKKRSEAAEMYKQGNAQDRAEQEILEKEIIDSYLPEKISEVELENIVQESVDRTGATSIADMGKVIGIVRQRVGATAEGSDIARIVKTKLGNS